MAYVTLSTEIKKLVNAQRSDTFVKELRAAVRDGTVEAADLPARFTLPKEFSRRGEEDTYRRDVRDMIIEVTPAYEAWFADMNKELAVSRRGGTVKPTLENIEAGLVDFKALAEATRQKMQSSFTKGQTLGKSRKGSASTRKPAPRKGK
ncbi:hypothetical protein HNQ07_001878 [Deinococcus metalli]|uniref:Uncharacterized protein n=1 Tax=Deinococcus metalli TaxID=1141878 RepID=A0A7W8NN20_9DEIO|nr:hypothetical protein [Deinococcus metalli]MBB5376414.1 hypothetical protein [Deinococcus metalli]GHF44236.1 hypothetical protein GCM10017781_20900 [Deinococcus metalli]